MTTTERWQRIEATFDGASELAAAERAAYLDAACDGDAELRREVEGLLASSEVADASLRTAISTAVDLLSTSIHDNAIGKALGPYRLVGLLGEGGMGTVYLAERDDAAYQRKVAIKILRHELASPQVIARFRDERQILAQLEHPAIVRLLDGGATESRLPYLVMEYVDGTPFATYARELAVRDRIELVIRLAAALEHAHGKLIVHRDIKPSNILVDSTGDPKLLDFGIAKLVDESGAAREAKTRTGMALLTPEYASPEQARSEPVSVATDVYSMGAVLYDTLVGRPPQHAGTSALDTLRIICEVEPPRPSTVAPPEIRRELSGDLDSIVLKALQKRPRDRYATMGALVDDLRRFLDGQPVGARDATLGYRARKFVRRHRGKLALATAIVGALIGATVFSVVQARRADRQAVRAAAENLALLRERGWQELQTGFPGRALPYLVAGLRAEPESAALRLSIAEAAHAFDNELAWFDLHEGIFGVFPSEDGMRFVVSFAGGLRVYDRDGAQVFDVHQPGAAFSLPTLSVDGARLVAEDPAGVIRIWDVATGQLQHTLAPALPETRSLTITDAGQIVGITHAGKIAIWELATGRLLHELADEPTFSTAVATSTGRIAIQRLAGDVAIYDAANGRKVRELPTPPQQGTLMFFPDGRLLIAGNDRVSIWSGDADSGPTVLIASSAPIFTIAADPTGQRLALTPTSGSTKIYDAHTGALTTQLIGHPNGAYFGRFDLDGRRILTAGRDSTYRIWNVVTGEQELVVEARLGGGAAPHSPAGVGLGGGFLIGNRLWIATGIGVGIWRVDRRTYESELETGTFPLATVPSPDRRTWLITAVDGASLWDTASRRKRVRVPVDVRVDDASWAPDGRHFAIAGNRGTARIFDAEGDIARDLVGHTGSVNRVAYEPSGARIATAGDDHTVRIWNAATGSSLAVLPHPDRVMAATWSPDGTRIATSGWEGNVRLWDASSYQLVTTLSKSNVQFLDVEFAPDGQHLVSTAHGGDIDIWTLDGTHEVSLVGHTNSVTTALWNPGGGLLASTGSDGTVRIWDARSGKQLASWESGVETMGLFWSPDGSQITTTCSCGKVRTWNVRLDSRTVDEIEAFAAEHSPYRLVEGRLERR